MDRLRVLRALFLDHPESVGETYREHQKMAFRFALRLLGAGLACAIHGIVPALFTRTGSRTVEALHKEMVANRGRATVQAQHLSSARAR